MVRSEILSRHALDQRRAGIKDMGNMETSPWRRIPAAVAVGLTLGAVLVALSILGVPLDGVKPWHIGILAGVTAVIMIGQRTRN